MMRDKQFLTAHPVNMMAYRRRYGSTDSTAMAGAGLLAAAAYFHKL